MQQTPIKKFRYDLSAAFAAIQRLLANKEDTKAVFDIMRALSGRGIPNNYERLLRTVEGGRMAFEAKELAPILDDHDRLRALPPGSLGRVYVEFMQGAKISAEGLADESRKSGNQEIDAAHPYAWMARRMRDIHDLWHVLSGHTTDALGEACLVAFSYAQTGSKGFALIAIAGGNEIAKALPGRPVRKAVWQAYRNGRQAAWLPGVDYEPMLAMPLEEVRKLLNIQAPTLYQSIPANERNGIGVDLRAGPAQVEPQAA